MPSSLGPAEILVILVVALIVLGPKRLPEAGRQVGKALSEVRRWSQDVKYEMNQAFNAETVTRDPTPLADPPPPISEVTVIDPIPPAEPAAPVDPAPPAEPVTSTDPVDPSSEAPADRPRQ